MTDIYVNAGRYDLGKKVVTSGNLHGYDYAIVSNPICPCAYVRIPENSPAFRHGFDDLEYELWVHGGITYSEEMGVPADSLTEGKWVGWDYGHIDDFTWGCVASPGDKRWTEAEVFSEITDCIEQLENIDKEDNE